MTKKAKFWSSTVIVASGALISPLAAPVLQLLNYQFAGEKKEIRNSTLWIIGMLLAIIGWNTNPLQLSTLSHMIGGALFAFMLVVIWFFSYGRFFPQKIDSAILTSATSRSAILGIIIAIAVAIISYYTVLFTLKVFATE